MRKLKNLCHIYILLTTTTVEVEAEVAVEDEVVTIMEIQRKPHQLNNLLQL
jgi:hypothetical protein